MNGRSVCFTLSLFAMALAGRSPAMAQEDVASFYKGKNVMLQVGSASGGGYDALGRVVARHIGRHIPGSPTIVVQNVPGGGSLQLANQFANITPRNGTVFAIMNNGAPSTPLLTPEAAHYDSRKFNFLGSPSREIQVVVVTPISPVQSVPEMFTKELLVGATAPGGAVFDYPLLTNAVIKTRFKIVKGYPGTADIMLALQRGEVHAVAGLGWAAIKAEFMDMINRKDFLIIAQYGMKPHRELMNVPMMPLGETEEDRQLFDLMYSRQDYGRPFLAPPDVPADRLAALRAAFEATMRDSGFAVDMARMKLEIDPVSWQELRDLTDRLFQIKPEVVKRMQAALSGKPE